jgi:hypothetical protein
MENLVHLASQSGIVRNQQALKCHFRCHIRDSPKETGPQHLSCEIGCPQGNAPLASIFYEKLQDSTVTTVTSA